MKAIVTGSSGTVGSALMKALERQGHEAVGWDRSATPIDDYQAMYDYIESEKPDVLYHLAMPSRPTGRENEDWLVSWHWTSELAWITWVQDIRFVYTSTVMVWTNKVPGPLKPSTPPDETEGYGAGKRRAEERIWHQNSKAIIARLGWQIGSAPGGNNMIEFFHQRMREDGVVRASEKWMPACSFVDDTASTLIDIRKKEPGLYLINSNRDMNFFEIASGLAKQHDDAWKVEKTDDFVCDQRMIDDRVKMPNLRDQINTA